MSLATEEYDIGNTIFHCMSLDEFPQRVLSPNIWTKHHVYGLPKVPHFALGSDFLKTRIRSTQVARLTFSSFSVP